MGRREGGNECIFMGHIIQLSKLRNIWMDCWFMAKRLTLSHPLFNIGILEKQTDTIIIELTNTHLIDLKSLVRSRLLDHFHMQEV